LSWKIEVSETARKQMKKLDRQTQRQIISYLQDRISTAEDPRLFGRALKGNLAGLWRYRVGSFRIICHIQDDRLLVLVLVSMKDSNSSGGSRKKAGQAPKGA